MVNSRQPDKILGVLGGMGPAAAAEFLRLLAERAPVSRDQEHAVTYLLSDPQVPDRSSAILGTGEDPTERLKKTSSPSRGGEPIFSPSPATRPIFSSIASGMSCPSPSSTSSTRRWGPPEG